MSIDVIAYRFLTRGGTAANLAAVNEIPFRRELIVELDTGLMKIGDGVTAYNDLAYTAGGGGGSSDGGLVFGGGDRVNYVTVGLKAPQPIDFDATILRWRLLTDNTASNLTVDLRKSAFGSYPPTVGDSIVASAPPSLVGSNHATTTALTGWDVDIAAGDVILPVVTVVAGVKWWNLTLHIEKA